MVEVDVTVGFLHFIGKFVKSVNLVGPGRVNLVGRMRVGRSIIMAMLKHFLINLAQTSKYNSSHHLQA